MTEAEIIQRIECAAQKLGVSESTLCEKAVGNSRLHSRLVSGGSCSLKTFKRLSEYLAEQEGAA